MGKLNLQDLRKRDWMWANGAVLCDKFLKHGESLAACAMSEALILTRLLGRCSRDLCTYQHRAAKDGEKIPLCWDFFKNRGEAALRSPSTYTFFADRAW
jgi:hypothetical protein